MSVEAVLDRIAGSAPAEEVKAPSPSATPEAANPPAEVPPVSTEGQPATEGAETIEQPETEPDIEVAPESSGDFEKYKPLFKDHPELRNIIGREKAFTELGQFSEVKGIVERIPTLADAEQLVEDADAKRALGQTFREDVPAFVESLKESDPLAFQQFVKSLPQVLAEAAPEAYIEQARFYVNNAFDYLFSMAQRAGDQELATAVQRVALQGLGYQIGSAVAAQQPARQDNSELARLRREKQEREQSDQQSAADSFWQAADAEIIDSTVAEIEATIKKALPAATPAQLQRMVREAYDGTKKNLTAQPQYVAKANEFRQAVLKGRRTVAFHTEIVSSMTSRAKSAASKAAKSVIDEWTKTVLKINQDTTEKRKEIAAKTRDVGSGPQGTTSTGAPARPNNGQRRGVNTILSELAAGTYVSK